jgi:hypothetical protein
MTPRAQSELDKTSQEPAASESDPAEVSPHEGQDEKQIEEHDVQYHGTGQNPAGFELSTLTRQPSVSVNPQPQLAILTQSTRPNNPTPHSAPQHVSVNPQSQQAILTQSMRPNDYTPPSTPQHTQVPNSQGGKGMGGWLKSIKESF